MFEPNVEKLLGELKPTDVVLDIGGWACPFNRANWVIDSGPYASRGHYGNFGAPRYQGGAKEHFTEKTWIQRDVCDREPFPFADKSIDFAVCSHTLEDLRDPLGVCSELVRVAKRGYIEVPSRAWETCRGQEQPNEVGLSHHRWLIDIEKNRIRFLMKLHMIHTHWRFSFPASYSKRMDPARKVQWLWWEDRFDFEETVIHGIYEMEAALEKYVQTTRPYPDWLLALDRRYRAMTFFKDRVRNKCYRILGW